MGTDLREQVLLFLDFMSKYSHVDLQLLTLRQLLAQFEKETDSLLNRRERRMFAELTVAFVARRQEAAVAAASPATSPSASSTEPIIAKSVTGPALTSASTKRLISVASASPAGSECSQMSLDGITGLVRQSGARILSSSTTPIKSLQQQQQSQPPVSTYCIPVTSASSGQKQMIHIQVQRVSQQPSTSTVAMDTDSSRSKLDNIPASDEEYEDDDFEEEKGVQKSNSRLSQQQKASADEARRALSSRYSDLLRVHKESGLEFPKKQLASATDLAEKVATLEDWLLARGLPWPLTLESAKLFARANRIASGDR
uniref:Nudc_N domain-containing protein n=2 Tax=Macrostomum lignano TaxID=282301 RepID=A0A1I8JGY4_9PLAT